ncbi:hypothetical protein EV361DRAFT_872061 [Lentinula raphanica]|nr:hypothetical protein EV361DRAFT_872061 [Lentinula raphanica]
MPARKMGVLASQQINGYFAPHGLPSFYSNTELSSPGPPQKLSRSTQPTTSSTTSSESSSHPPTKFQHPSVPSHLPFTSSQVSSKVIPLDGDPITAMLAHSCRTCRITSDPVEIRAGRNGIGRINCEDTKGIFFKNAQDTGSEGKNGHQTIRANGGAGRAILAIYFVDDPLDPKSTSFMKPLKIDFTDPLVLGYRHFDGWKSVLAGVVNGTISSLDIGQNFGYQSSNANIEEVHKEFLQSGGESITAGQDKTKTKQSSRERVYNCIAIYTFAEIWYEPFEEQYSYHLYVLQTALDILDNNAPMYDSPSASKGLPLEAQRFFSDEIG